MNPNDFFGRAVNLVSLLSLLFGFSRDNRVVDSSRDLCNRAGRLFVRACRFCRFFEKNCWNAFAVPVVSSVRNSFRGHYVRRLRPPRREREEKRTRPFVQRKSTRTCTRIYYNIFFTHLHALRVDSVNIRLEKTIVMRTTMRLPRE